MDSINQNQEEENRKNLAGSPAIDKVKELAETSKTCFFSTQSQSSPSQGTRPMSVQEVDEAGNIWFLMSNDSHTYQEIQADPAVKLYFQGSAHSDFLYLEGAAKASTDRNKIEKYWSPLLKTWFTEGENDPRIAVVSFTPSSGYYWDNKNGNAIAAIKIAAGAVLGKTIDDSIEGKINI